MSKTPELPVNSVAKVLPIIWLFTIITIAIAAYFYISSGALAQQFLGLFKKQVDSYITPSISPTGVLKTTSVPSAVATNKPTSTPTKKPVACYRLNIREGEFASNKCYSRTDYDNLYYYLQRLDSAKFDLTAAQNSINITCNCRVPQECEFFKDSCTRDKAQKSQAETNINTYTTTIRSIIGRGR
ncbi:MAG: hypothetical protein WAV41_00565 [Microgenomates group bacterium]